MLSTIAQFTARAAQLPTTEQSRLQRLSISGGDRHAVIFNDSDTQEAIFSLTELPHNYQGGTLTLNLECVMATATTGTIKINTYVECVTAGDAINVDTTASFDTANLVTASVPNSVGKLFYVSIPLTYNDTATVGDLIRVKITRDTTGTATGDLRVLGGSLSETITQLDLSGYASIKGSGYTFPTADGTANQVIKTDGAGNLSFGVGGGGGGGGIASVSADTTPTLGGNLSLAGHNVGGVTPTELGYVSGVTSSIQTQINNKANTSSLSTVATSGSYVDLTNKPTIPSAQVNSDWTSGSGVSQILNKPTLGTAAALDTGTTANKVVKLDGSAHLPAVDGSALTGLTKTQVGLGNVPNTDCTNATNLTSGAIPAARLPFPSQSSLGGVQSKSIVSQQFMTGISTSGVPTTARPSYTDISGLGSAAQINVGTSYNEIVQLNSSAKLPAVDGSNLTNMTKSQVGLGNVVNSDTTYANNITSGTLAIAQGGTGQTTATDAINGLLPSQGSQTGKVLSTNGSIASWQPITASAGGSDGQIQINSSGSLLGVSGLYYNGSFNAPNVVLGSTTLNDGYLQNSNNYLVVDGEISAYAGSTMEQGFKIDAADGGCHKGLVVIHDGTIGNQIEVKDNSVEGEPVVLNVKNDGTLSNNNKVVNVRDTLTIHDVGAGSVSTNTTQAFSAEVDANMAWVFAEYNSIVGGYMLFDGVSCDWNATPADGGGWTYTGVATTGNITATHTGNVSGVYPVFENHLHLATGADATLRVVILNNGSTGLNGGTWRLNTDTWSYTDLDKTWDSGILGPGQTEPSYDIGDLLMDDTLGGSVPYNGGATPTWTDGTYDAFDSANITPTFIEGSNQANYMGTITIIGDGGGSNAWTLNSTNMAVGSTTTDVGSALSISPTDISLVSTGFTSVYTINTNNDVQSLVSTATINNLTNSASDGTDNVITLNAGEVKASDGTYFTSIHNGVITGKASGTLPDPTTDGEWSFGWDGDTGNFVVKLYNAGTVKTGTLTLS